MDNRRLILVFIFSFCLVMLWDAWQKYSHPQPPVAATTGTPAATAPQATTASPASASAVPQSGAIGASKAETISIKTDRFIAEVSTQGGDLVGLELSGYKSATDKSKNFSLFGPKHQYAAQSGLMGDGLPNHKTVFTAVAGPRELTGDAKSIQLRLEAPVVDGVKVVKIFTFNRDSYLIDVTYEIDNGSGKALSPSAYYQLQRDEQSPEGEARSVSTFTGPAVYTAQNHYQKVDFSDIEKGKAKFNAKADNGWLAMVQHYFVSAWVPPEKLEREFYMRRVDGANPVAQVGVIIPVAPVAPGSKVSTAVSLFAGPQIQSELSQLAKPVADGGIGAENLVKVVDYGWLDIIAEPIFWCLQAIHKLVGNWGWAIILLTVCIKALFFPLSAASYKSMAKMKAIAPRMTALRERCGDDKQKLNLEMMNLYKTEKINPLGGCLPIVVQIPVFLALYWTLLGAVEMRDAPWMFWIHDLSSQDPYYVLPLIMMATMFIQTKLNPTPPDPIQAKMTMFMPLIFGGMFLFFPSGLVLYWVVNNVLSIAQQWQITRMFQNGGKAANDAKA